MYVCSRTNKEICFLVHTSRLKNPLANIIFTEGQTWPQQKLCPMYSHTQIHLILLKNTNDYARARTA